MVVESDSLNAAVAVWIQTYRKSRYPESPANSNHILIVCLASLVD
jgi:hypothetical protein